MASPALISADALLSPGSSLLFLTHFSLLYGRFTMEDITYAEMNLTVGKGRRQGKTNTVSLQDEDLGVTYVAVKKTPGEKKERTAKQQKGLEYPQNEEKTITYATVHKNNYKFQQEDPERGEDVTVTYAALMETTKRRSRRDGGAQEVSLTGQCEEKRSEDTRVMIRGEQESWVQRLNPGRRWSELLVPVLVILCVTLLIIIGTRVSCKTGRIRNGTGSTISSSADWSSPCPDPWILITDKCYFFSEDRKNRRDSEKDCEERDSKLATVKEGRILTLVTTTEQEFWIGLFSLGTHHNGGTWSGRWSDGSVVNVTEGSGTCAKIHRVLKLHNCNGDLHWICERDVRDP